MRKVLFLLLILAPCRAYGVTPLDQNQPVKTELIFESEQIIPGKPVRIGVKFLISKPWHIYWKEPGDAGLPTRISYSGPPGLEVGELVWPPHVKFVQPGDITGYGYESDVELSAPLVFKETKEDKVTLNITARWLSCSNTVCIPGTAKFTKDFHLAKGIIP